MTTVLLSNLRAHLYSLYQGQHIAMETTAAKHNLVIPAQPNTSRSRENRESACTVRCGANSKQQEGAGSGSGSS